MDAASKASSGIGRRIPSTLQIRSANSKIARLSSNNLRQKASKLLELWRQNVLGNVDAIGMMP